MVGKVFSSQQPRPGAGLGLGWGWAGEGMPDVGGGAAQPGHGPAQLNDGFCSCSFQFDPPRDSSCFRVIIIPA